MKVIPKTSIPHSSTDQKVLTKKEVCAQTLPFLPIALIDIINDYSAPTFKEGFTQFTKIEDFKSNVTRAKNYFTKISEDLFVKGVLLEFGDFIPVRYFYATVHTNDGKFIKELPSLEITACTPFTNHRFLTGDLHGNINVWDTKTISCIKQLSNNPKTITKLLYLHDSMFASVNRDFEINIWKETKAGFSIDKTLNGHTAPITSLAFLPDNNYLVSSCRVINVWNINTGICLFRFSNHTDPVLALTALSQNTFFSVSTRGVISSNLFYHWDISKFLNFRKRTEIIPQNLSNIFPGCSTKVQSLDSENVLLSTDKLFGILNVKTNEFVQHPEINNICSFAILSESLLVIGKENGSFSLYAYSEVANSK